MNTNVFRSLSYGVYLITAWDDKNSRFTGCTANSVMQVTSSPATLAVSINHDNYTNSCIKQSGALAVNIVAETTDPAYIGAMGFTSGRDTEKLAAIPHNVKDGAAIIEGCCGYIAGKVLDTLETSTHTVFLIEAVDGEPAGTDTPMTYSYYHKVVKGKTAKNAPTFIPEAEANTQDEKWRCKVCGYVHHGPPPFAQLPDTWLCPLCGAPKSQFEKV